jgi:membrane associated rhomboid family serine protease
MRDAAVGHQCPECVAEGRRTQRPVRTAFGGNATAGREGYVTKALIGLNLLAALIGVAVAGPAAIIGNGLFTSVTKWQWLGGVISRTVTVASDGRYIPGAALPEFGTVYAGVADGAYYRLFTAMFIHFGPLHLLLNMWALWILGRNLEAVLGPIRFLALYLLAGIGGNVACFLLDQNTPSAGASTAVYGLFAAFFLVQRRLGRDTSAVIGLLVVNLVLTFAIPSISKAGHLGGLVTGALVGAILAYAPQAHRTVVQVAGTVAVFLLLVALTLARTASYSL